MCAPLLLVGEGGGEVHRDLVVPTFCAEALLSSEWEGLRGLSGDSCGLVRVHGVMRMHACDASHVRHADDVRVACDGMFCVDVTHAMDCIHAVK